MSVTKQPKHLQTEQKKFEQQAEVSFNGKFSMSTKKINKSPPKRVNKFADVTITTRQVDPLQKSDITYTDDSLNQRSEYTPEFTPMQEKERANDEMQAGSPSEHYTQD